MALPQYLRQAASRCSTWRNCFIGSVMSTRAQFRWHRSWHRARPAPKQKARSKLSLNIWSSWPRLVGRFAARCRRNRSTLATTCAALPSESGGGTRAAGHDPASCCRILRGARPCALLARRPYRLRAHHQCGAPRLAVRARRNFRFGRRQRRQVVCRVSDNGAATRPPGQASEHVSSMRSRWNSTVMLSDNSVKTEQR